MLRLSALFACSFVLFVCLLYFACFVYLFASTAVITAVCLYALNAAVTDPTTGAAATTTGAAAFAAAAAAAAAASKQNASGFFLHFVLTPLKRKTHIKITKKQLAVPPAV